MVNNRVSDCLPFRVNRKRLADRARLKEKSAASAGYPLRTNTQKGWAICPTFFCVSFRKVLILDFQRDVVDIVR